jgi:hypothetical protein
MKGAEVKTKFPLKYSRKAVVEGRLAVPKVVPYGLFLLRDGCNRSAIESS